MEGHIEQIESAALDADIRDRPRFECIAPAEQHLSPMTQRRLGLGLIAVREGVNIHTPIC